MEALEAIDAFKETITPHLPHCHSQVRSGIRGLLGDIQDSGVRLTRHELAGLIGRRLDHRLLTLASRAHISRRTRLRPLSSRLRSEPLSTHRLFDRLAVRALAILEATPPQAKAAARQRLTAVRTHATLCILGELSQLYIDCPQRRRPSRLIGADEMVARTTFADDAGAQFCRLCYERTERYVAAHAREHAGVRFLVIGHPARAPDLQLSPLLCALHARSKRDYVAANKPRVREAFHRHYAQLARLCRECDESPPQSISHRRLIAYLLARPQHARAVVGELSRRSQAWQKHAAGDFVRAVLGTLPGSSSADGRRYRARALASEGVWVAETFHTVSLPELLVELRIARRDDMTFQFTAVLPDLRLAEVLAGNSGDCVGDDE